MKNAQERTVRRQVRHYFEERQIYLPTNIEDGDFLWYHDNHQALGDHDPVEAIVEECWYDLDCEWREGRIGGCYVT